MGTHHTCPHKPHLTHLAEGRVSSETADSDGGTGGRWFLQQEMSNPETASQIKAPRGWGIGELFDGYRFSVWKVLEMDSSDGCMT